METTEWTIYKARRGDILSDGKNVLIVDSIDEFEGEPVITSLVSADSKRFYDVISTPDRWYSEKFRPASKLECECLLMKMTEFVRNNNRI